MSDDRDDPNPRAPVPPGLPPPPSVEGPKLKDVRSWRDLPPAAGRRITPEEIAEFLRSYEKRMGITRRPPLSSEVERPGRRGKRER